MKVCLSFPRDLPDCSPQLFHCLSPWQHSVISKGYLGTTIKKVVHVHKAWFNVRTKSQESNFGRKKVIDVRVKSLQGHGTLVQHFYIISLCTSESIMIIKKSDLPFTFWESECYLNENRVQPSEWSPLKCNNRLAPSTQWMFVARVSWTHVAATLFSQSWSDLWSPRKSLSPLPGPSGLLLMRGWGAIEVGMSWEREASQLLLCLSQVVGKIK